MQGLIVDQQAGKQYAELIRVAKSGDRSAAPIGNWPADGSLDSGPSRANNERGQNFGSTSALPHSNCGNEGRQGVGMLSSSPRKPAIQTVPSPMAAIGVDRE